MHALSVLLVSAAFWYVAVVLVGDGGKPHSSTNPYTGIAFLLFVLWLITLQAL